jgi:hypothetical protein
MDVRIYENEEIRITAVDQFGNEYHHFVSFQQILNSGQKLIDGLVQAEIDELEKNKKIMAIKLYRLRTGKSLKDAKQAIDDWVAKHRCCARFPYCEHEDELSGLDLSLLERRNVGSLSLTWKYPAEITITQAEALQTKSGYPETEYGLYSFSAENGVSRWASNRYTGDEL